MKLPITDQFLWDLINALDKGEDMVRFLLHPPRNFSEIAFSADSPTYRKYRKILHTKKFAWLIYYLKKNNYIKAKQLEGKKTIMLTKKAIDKVLLASFKTESKAKRKDGKWIMIAFDIPQKHPKARLLMRSVLKNLGYKMFQQSVWVTPYDVFDKTEQLLQYHSLDTYVRIFLIEEL